MIMVTFDNDLHGYGLSIYIGTLMAIVGESQWMTLIDQFCQIFEDHHMAALTSSILLLYAVQFLLKHLVFSFFFGAVISSTHFLSDSTMVARVKAFIFNEETIDQLTTAWMEHDSEGTGLMEASHYIDFVMNLKHPIALNPQDLKKKLKSLTLDMKAIYNNLGHNANAESLDGLSKLDGFGESNFITRQTFKENKDKSIRLTVDQFFVYCRLYNVPVYIQQNKW